MSEDPSVAYQALNLAKQNARDIEKHEDICAERYRGIHTAIDELKSGTKDSMDEIKSVLWKAGGGAFSIILTVLGFLLVQQLNSNAKIRDDSAAKIDQLERRLVEERANRIIQGTPHANATPAN